QTDVDALARLLPVMLPRLDLPRALLRGRYMAAAARMEWNSVPLDADTFDRLRAGWERIKGRLIEEVDRDYQVFIPVGQRTIDPDTRLGAALVAPADEWGIDAHQLAGALDTVWREEREATAELVEAQRAARKATGLTPRRIEQWESAGQDYSLFPGLDVKAQELAGEWP